METKTLINELKVALVPYEFYWEEWIGNENCNLTNDDLSLINYYQRMNFKLTLFQHLRVFKELEAIKTASKKLVIGRQVFKDFVVVSFLSTIIMIARDYSYDAFLQTPIRDLNIPNNLKTILLKFKARTLQLLFFTCKVEEFSGGWMYEVIVDFQIAYRSQKDGLTFKNMMYEIENKP